MTTTESRHSTETAPLTPPAMPFLKWPGGKADLVADILPHVPPHFGSYHERCLGGGALFFELRARGMLDGKPVVLSDASPELITAYRAIRSSVEEVIEVLSRHVNTEEDYYRIRDMPSPELFSDPTRAARTIYLNKTGFRGLHRVNKSGRHNVPFGFYKNPTICDAANLHACSKALRGVLIEHEDFARVERDAAPGDLVFLDPPYVPIPGKLSFTSYTAEGWTRSDDERCAAVVDHLVARGAHVLTTNSDTPRARELYQRHEIVSLVAGRGMCAGDGKGRARVGEILVVGRPAPRAARPLPRETA